MKNPKVTVVVINFNGKPLIKRCLDSVMRQSYKNFDIMFFDNGSTDGSADYVKKNFPKVKLMRITPNDGVARAQQESYSAAKGEYIASLHIDAVAHKDWLKELVKTMQESNGKVACAQSMVYQENEKMDGSTNLLSSNIINIYKDQKEKFYAGTAAMILKNGVTNTYCDPEYYFYSEDLYLGWVLRLKGYKVVRAFNSRVDHQGTHSAKSQKIKEKYQFFNERNRILNILSFYQGKTLAKLFPILLTNIALKSVNNIRREPWKFKVHMKSYAWLLGNLGTVLKKRKKIQSLRKVGDDRITPRLSSKIAYEGEGKIYKIVNKSIENYCRLVGLKTMETN